MKIRREEIIADPGSSFKILLTPGLNDTFLWHFHPEYEIVYVESAGGTRHVGDHISTYENSDLVFIGPYIPHLNFDYGVRTECEQVIVQMKENFLGKDFLNVAEFSEIKKLFDKAAYGLSFSGNTKNIAGKKLKQLPALNHFDRIILLLEVFQLLASTDEVTVLNLHPAMNKFFEKDQKRMDIVYQYIEANYLQKPDVNEAAKQAHLTTAAFCRFFKKNSKMTFTDFVNQYRINRRRIFYCSIKLSPKLVLKQGLIIFVILINSSKNWLVKIPPLLKSDICKNNLLRTITTLLCLLLAFNQAKSGFILQIFHISNTTIFVISTELQKKPLSKSRYNIKSNGKI